MCTILYIGYMQKLHRKINSKSFNSFEHSLYFVHLELPARVSRVSGAVSVNTLTISPHKHFSNVYSLNQKIL